MTREDYAFSAMSTENCSEIPSFIQSTSMHTMQFLNEGIHFVTKNNCVATRSYLLFTDKNSTENVIIMVYIKKFGRG